MRKRHSGWAGGAGNDRSKGFADKSRCDGYCVSILSTIELGGFAALAMRLEKGLTMDKLSAMKAFVRVVEAGTFTKAADSLGVPKAQMTRLVQSLEEDLKTLLLNRTTRRVTVTADGAAYYDRAVRVLEEIEELESSLTHAKVNPRGKLRIDAPSAIANLILIPAMGDFCARYPDIQIDIGASDRPIDLIAENVDCVLRVGEVTDQSLVARRIGEIRPIVCASPAYLKRFGVPQHPSDLEDDRHRVIAFFVRGSERVTYVLHRGDERYELNPKSTIAVNDSGAMLAAGLAGLGIARIGPSMVAPHLAAGTLQVVLPEWCAGVWPLYVVYPPNRHVSAKVRAFIDWVVDLFGRVQNAPVLSQATAGQCSGQDAMTARLLQHGQ
jgi:DNA-binding transcriptional LysR family regulator